jgi:hypothetical protein
LNGFAKIATATKVSLIRMDSCKTNPLGLQTLMRCMAHTHVKFGVSNATTMNTTHQNTDFQLGLLHFIHLLVTADGFVDEREREREMIDAIRQEEQIPTTIFQSFVRNISGKAEREVFLAGIDLLDACTEEERLCAFVHLYRLAQSDDRLDVREVKFLLYSLKKTRIEFEDVVMGAQLANAQAQARNRKRVA